MGIGIWSMHFVGMLALPLPVSVSYDVSLITLSLLWAIGSSAVAFAIVSREVIGRRLFWAGGACMGVAISGMHYTAMAAMRLPASIQYDTRLVTLSVAIAIVASFAALRVAFDFRSAHAHLDSWPNPVPAVLMGLGIVGMHYTAMAAARFTPHPLSVGLSSRGGRRGHSRARHGRRPRDGRHAWDG